MKHWQSELSKREFKIGADKDNICQLMTELRIKDSLLREKDNIIGIYGRFFFTNILITLNTLV